MAYRVPASAPVTFRTKNTFPKEPSPSTLSSSNCDGSALSCPSLTTSCISTSLSSLLSTDVSRLSVVDAWRDSTEFSTTIGRLFAGCADVLS